jgi:hypothetical protein
MASDGSYPPPSQLRGVVEAACEIDILTTPAGRDAVLALLRPDLASAIARSPTPRLDVIQIVTTCARYPGGLTELVEAIRVFARGSIAISRLDAAIAELPPEAELHPNE